MINAKQLGYRIRLEREKNHLTQEQLGAAINYTKQQISNWERGINMPSPDILLALSKQLNFNFLTELTLQGNDIMSDLPNLESYKNPKDLLMTVNELVDSIPLASSNDAPIRYMLSTTLWVAIGLEYHILTNSEYLEPEYCPWNHIADTLYSLAVDGYGIGDHPSQIVTSDEVDQWENDHPTLSENAIPARMKYKIERIIDFINADQINYLSSSECFGFDPTEHFESLEHKMADYGIFMGERLNMILPSKENDLFSSYKIALYRLAEIIDVKSFYRKNTKEWQPTYPIELS